jgi:hypothetical protein
MKKRQWKRPVQEAPHDNIRRSSLWKEGKWHDTFECEKCWRAFSDPLYCGAHLIKAHQFKPQWWKAHHDQRYREAVAAHRAARITVGGGYTDSGDRKHAA